MKNLPEVDGKFKLLKANTTLRFWAVLSTIAFVSLLVAFFCFRANLSTKVEMKLRDEYGKEITELQDKIEKQKDSYEEKLEKQKNSYEDKIEKQQEAFDEKASKTQKEHDKAIEKKEQQVAKLEEKIELLKAQYKISIDYIESEIQSVGKLTTIDYRYTYSGTHEDTLEFFGHKLGITKNSFIAQWNGVVAIGVDMSKVAISINESTRVVTISMPNAEILYHDVDEKSFELLDEKNNMLNPISIEDKIQFDIKYEEAIFTRIEEMRLLKDAYNNAKLFIENILKADSRIASDYSFYYAPVK